MSQTYELQRKDPFQKNSWGPIYVYIISCLPLLQFSLIIIFPQTNRGTRFIAGKSYTEFNAQGLSWTFVQKSILFWWVLCLSLLVPFTLLLIFEYLVDFDLAFFFFVGRLFLMDLNFKLGFGGSVVGKIKL